MTKSNYLIPFDKDGNQQDYPGWGEIDWRQNEPFDDTLTFKNFGRGRSSVTFYFERSNGARVTMFVKDFSEALPHMRKGKLRGTFCFIKRGANYGTKLVKPAPLKHPPYQKQVANWAIKCFGLELVKNKFERAYRFLEEALELAQALGVSKRDVLKLVDYVYGRPVGNPKQEVGGVMTTLGVLCEVNDIDMNLEAEKELERIWGKIPEIQAKNAAKPTGSPLPGFSRERPENCRERLQQEGKPYPRSGCGGCNKTFATGCPYDVN